MAILGFISFFHSLCCWDSRENPRTIISDKKNLFSQDSKRLLIVSHVWAKNFKSLVLSLSIPSNLFKFCSLHNLKSFINSNLIIGIVCEHLWSRKKSPLSCIWEVAEVTALSELAGSIAGVVKPSDLARSILVKFHHCDEGGDVEQVARTSEQFSYVCDCLSLSLYSLMFRYLACSKFSHLYMFDIVYWAYIIWIKRAIEAPLLLIKRNLEEKF